jgi:hypothetical protein
VGVLCEGSDHYRQLVQDAVADGSLAQTVPLPFRTVPPLYAHDIHDCLVLSMLVYPQQGRRTLEAISPILPGEPVSLTFPDHYPPTYHCRNLARIIADPQAVPMGRYHRYLNGPWTYLGVLLAFARIKTATVVSITVSYGLLGFLALAALRRGWRRRALEQPCARDFGFFTLALSLMLFSGINVFAYSLTLMPADYVVSIFLIFSYFRPLDVMSERRFVMLTTGFGCLTAAFEFMTGGIVVGLTALLTSLALGEAPRAQALFRRALLGGFCFCAAVGICFALKMAVVATLWGPRELTVFGSQLAMRTGASQIVPFMSQKELGLLRRMGLSPSVLEGNRAIATVYAFVRLAYSSFTLAFGSHVLGALLVGGGWVAAVVTNWKGTRSALSLSTRSMSAALLVAALLAPVWYLVFPNHIILHSYFMVRPLAWAPALFLTGLVYRRSVRHSPAIGKVPHGLANLDAGNLVSSRRDSAIE